MTPENFVYWLQGFAELYDYSPNDDQWRSIKEHLSLVMKKVTSEKGSVDFKVVYGPGDMSRPAGGAGPGTPAQGAGVGGAGPQEGRLC